jgi:hypothetical protein
VSEPEPALLELQRAAGNHAVTRMLARDFTFSPLRPGAAPNPLDPAAAAQSVLADHNAATQAIWDWFDTYSQPHRESGSVPGSVPELVAQACALPFTLKDGSQGVVRDKVPPPEAEEHLRQRARTLGLRLQEHRDASDVAGVRSELSAVLSNLGAIPTQLTLGDDDAKVVASLSGKITGELRGGGKRPVSRRYPQRRARRLLADPRRAVERDQRAEVGPQRLLPIGPRQQEAQRRVGLERRGERGLHRGVVAGRGGPDDQRRTPTRLLAPA